MRRFWKHGAALAVSLAGVAFLALRGTRPEPSSHASPPRTQTERAEILLSDREERGDPRPAGIAPSSELLRRWAKSGRDAELAAIAEVLSDPSSTPSTRTAAAAALGEALPSRAARVAESVLSAGGDPAARVLALAVLATVYRDRMGRYVTSEISDWLAGAVSDPRHPYRLNCIYVLSALETPRERALFESLLGRPEDPDYEVVIRSAAELRRASIGPALVAALERATGPSRRRAMIEVIVAQDRREPFLDAGVARRLAAEAPDRRIR